VLHVVRARDRRLDWIGLDGEEFDMSRQCNDDRDRMADGEGSVKDDSGIRRAGQMESGWMSKALSFGRDG